VYPSTQDAYSAADQRMQRADAAGAERRIAAPDIDLVVRIDSAHLPHAGVSGISPLDFSADNSGTVRRDDTFWTVLGHERDADQ
jgi:hypothetical protein